MATIETKKYSLSYYKEGDVIILENIEVIPEYRNKGIATKAMQRFMKRFKGKKIELHAYPQDESTYVNRLVAFYERFGFHTVAGWDEIGYEMRNY